MNRVAREAWGRWAECLAAATGQPRRELYRRALALQGR
jgi:hypothetical protein